MKRLLLISGVLGMLAVFSGPGFAKGKEDAPGYGGGGRGMPDDFREVIHSLFAEHGQVERKVKLTKKGYEAETTSGNAKVVKLLQTHVGQMESRLESGMGVRMWDPAFVEIRAHYADMDIEIEEIEQGVTVKVRGMTPEAVKVAKNHAKILSGFVEKGPEVMHVEHAGVLGEGAVATAGGGPGGKGRGKGACGGQCGGGGKCQGQGQGGGEGAKGKACGCGGKCPGKGGAEAKAAAEAEAEEQ